MTLRKHAHVNKNCYHQTWTATRPIGTISVQTNLNGTDDTTIQRSRGFAKVKLGVNSGYPRHIGVVEDSVVLIYFATNLKAIDDINILRSGCIVEIVR